jgi:hypothetical protein
MALIGLVLLSIAACGTTVWPRRPSSAQERANFARFAGPPINSFTYLLHYYAWTPLGHRQLVLWTDINDAYLITVLPPCVGLDFAYGVGVTSDAHMVTRGVDAITFDHQYCIISQIRHVNYLAMKRQLHTLP